MVFVQWTNSASAERTGLIARVRREFSAVRILALADRTVEPLRWQIMETGVVWLCTSPRELTPVVEIVRRHLEQVPEPQRTPEQRVWDELPWPRF